MRRILSFTVLVAAMLAGSVGATQYLARTFAYAPGLGDPLVSMGSAPLYPPFAWYRWQRQWGRHAKKDFLTAITMAVGGVFCGLGIAARLRGGERLPKPTGAYGTARWATVRELAKARLLSDRGIVLGQTSDAEFGQRSDSRWVMRTTSRLIRYDGDGHTFAFAPTRSGKGVTIVVPTLLSYTDGSVLVHDPKGENWMLTAAWRKQFSHCLRLEPTAEDSARFNPLLTVRPAPFDVRDAQNITEMLVNPDSMTNEQKDHWKLTGDAFLVGVILHVLYAEEDKSPPGVLHVLTDPDRPLLGLLEAMLQTRHLSSGPHPTVAGAARAMLNRSENERSGVLSTAISFLEIYRDPIIATNTSASDFTIADLMCAERPMSLYFVVPASDTDRTRPVVRLLLSIFGRRLTEHLNHVDGGPGFQTAAVAPVVPRRTLLDRILRAVLRRPNVTDNALGGRLQPKRRELLCLIDEFPQLGRVAFFASGISIMAGYRVRCLLIAQSLKQLEEVYGRSNSILDNCAVRVTYGTTCDQTAERISRLLGTQSLVKRQISVSKRGGLFGGEQVSETFQEYGRPLKTIEELLSMPYPEAIVMASNCHPYLGRKLLYYQDPRFMSRAGTVPPGRVNPPPTSAAELLAERPPRRGTHHWLTLGCSLRREPKNVLGRCSKAEAACGPEAQPASVAAPTSAVPEPEEVLNLGSFAELLQMDADPESDATGHSREDRA
jgi:type IV secretion system protein VirD4